MKIARWIIGSVIALAAVYGGLLLLLGTDTVTSNYATLQEAHADEVFARGWLPDILPASVHDISASNNLDLNTSAGEFRFAAADYPTFASRLRKYASLPSPFAGYVEKMQRRGYEASVFAEDASTWVFLCRGDRGYCEYRMWLHRE